MNVQKMNSKEEKIDEIVALQLLEEIEQNNNVSQRNLSNKLGIALGLVNTYIKLLVKKGYIRVANFPKSRYTYLLTPEGMAEKSRLVYKHLNYYNNMFKQVRNDSKKLFLELGKKGIKRIAFLGVDEIAEIIYLSLLEAELDFVGIYDDLNAGKTFLKSIVRPLMDLINVDADRLIITSIKRQDEFFSKINSLNIDNAKIITLKR
jgi:DNA-binding MarR family transcriptional regulator